MTPIRKALLLAGLHLALVAGLGGKYLLDRAIRPRVWLKAAPVDPDLPIRGRYVSLRVEVPVKGVQFPPAPSPRELAREPWRSLDLHALQVRLVPGPEGLIAHAVTPVAFSHDLDPSSWPDRVDARLPESYRAQDPARWTVRLEDPLAFFIPEQVPDPSLRAPGEELWVEATLPRKGPLRPIRLGVKKDGVLTPLPL